MIMPKTDRPSLRRRNTTSRRGLRLEALEQRNLLTVLAGDDSGPLFTIDEDTTLSSQGGVTEVPMISAGSVWSYLDDGSDQGTAWRDFLFDDSAWATGPAQLGYGDNDEATVVGGLDANAGQNYATTYFRQEFIVADPSNIDMLEIGLLRDDGAAVYLNGLEIVRDNLVAGATFNQFTGGGAVGGADEDTFFPFTFDLVAIPILVAGTNVIAVEIHQANGTSSDISFDLRMKGTSASDDPVPILGNDTGINTALPLTVNLNSNVSNGTLVLDPTGEFTYTPNANFSGTDSFSYLVDNDGVSNVATVTITINPVNDPPAAADDSGYSIPAGGTLNASLPADDGIELFAAGSRWAFNDQGVDLAGPDGTYGTPDDITDALGVLWREDQFDPSLSVDWTLENDPSNSGGPYGYGDPAPVTPIVGLDANPDGSNFTTTYFHHTFDIPGLVAGSEPLGLVIELLVDDGAAIFINGVEAGRSSLAAGAGFNDFATAVNNGVGEGVTVTIPVDNTGNPYGLRAAGNQIAVEVHQFSAGSSDVNFDVALRTASSAPIGVLGNDSDVEGDTLTITTIDGNPVEAGGNAVTDGTVVMAADGTFSFTPNAGFVGAASFSYTIDDGNGATATATVTIDVTATDTSPPEAIEDTPFTGVNFTTPEDVPLVVDNTGPSGPVGFGVLANDLHPGDEGDPLILTVVDDGVNAPVHDKANPLVSAGAVVLNNDGTFTYTPAADFNGIAEFTYQIDDTFNPVSTANVEILVFPVTDTSADTYSMTEDGSLVVDLRTAPDAIIMKARGANWDFLDLIKNGLDAGGVALDYPVDGFGSAWNDPDFDIGSSTIGPWGFGPAILGAGVIDVGAILTPLAGIDAATDGTSNDITTYLFRSDLNLTADQATATNLGVRLLSDDGGILYINGTEVLRRLMPAGPITTETFTTATGTENAYLDFTTLDIPAGVLHEGVNSIAFELHQTNATSSDVGFDIEITEVPVIAGVLDNDADEALITEVALVPGSGPSDGQLTLNNDGTFSYTPDPDFFGADTFQYVATAGGIDSLDTTVTINVTGVNDAPVVSGESYSVAVGDTLTPLGSLLDTAGGNQATVLLVGGSTWTYLDDGTDPGADWATVGFDDSGWTQQDDADNLGAVYGYGEGDEATVINGLDAQPNGDNFITSYFRTTFDPTDAGMVAGDVSELVLLLKRDDGAAVYINGTRIVLDNLADGAGSADFALAENAPADNATVAHLVDVTGLLVDGANTVAVEIHQASVTSSDVSFNLEINVLDDGVSYGLLFNDTDADGDVLTATIGLVPAGLEIGGVPATPGQEFDGVFTYTPPVGTPDGTVIEFIYVVSDGTVTSDPVTVQITVSNMVPPNPADVNGDGSNDLLDLAQLRRSLFNGTNDADANVDFSTDRADIPVIGQAIFASLAPSPSAASIVTGVHDDDGTDHDGDDDSTEDRTPREEIRDRIIAHIGDRFASILSRIADRHEGDEPSELHDRLSARFERIIAHITARLGHDHAGHDHGDAETDGDESPLRRLLRARRHHRHHDGAIGDMFG